jgi:hypothetical protein
MLLALGVCGVVAMVLAWQVAAKEVKARVVVVRNRIRHPREQEIAFYDPGRERRAESRARELLRSCVNEEDWAMYRDLGFVRVWGGGVDARDADGIAPYAYLIYPHKPIVAYVPQTGRLLNEYCVEFPDRERPYGSSRLPPSDDVLAKWLGLTGDERSLIASANLHLAGRQHDPDAVRADLAALSRWERARLEPRQPEIDPLPTA